jgi:hypothetical protein
MLAMRTLLLTVLSMSCIGCGALAPLLMVEKHEPKRYWHGLLQDVSVKDDHGTLWSAATLVLDQKTESPYISGTTKAEAFLVKESGSLIASNVVKLGTEVSLYGTLKRIKVLAPVGDHLIIGNGKQDNDSPVSIDKTGYCLVIMLEPIP